MFGFNRIPKKDERPAMRTLPFCQLFDSSTTGRTAKRRSRTIHLGLEQCEDRKLMSVTHHKLLPVTHHKPASAVIHKMPSTAHHKLATAPHQVTPPVSSVPTTTFQLAPPVSAIQAAPVQVTQARTWKQIGGPAGSIYAGSFGLVATDPTTGNLFHYVGTAGKWYQIGGPGNEFAMDTSSHLYGLAPNLTAVYQYTGNGTTNSWTKIGGPAGTITAGSFGLVATDPATGNLYHYLGTPGKWAQIGGPGFTFVMDGNSHLYGKSGGVSDVYQYTGNGSTNSWTKISGPMDTIYAGSFGLVATNAFGNLYRYLGTPNSWALIGGPGNMFVAGTTLYGLSPDRSAVYQYVGNGSNSSWTKIGGAADFITGSPTDSTLYALSPKTHNVMMFS
jgi:hypothetical protein